MEKIVYQKKKVELGETIALGDANVKLTQEIIDMNPTLFEVEEVEDTKYWEYTGGENWAGFTCGKIYELADGKSIKCVFALISDDGTNNGWGRLNLEKFKPSTKKDWLIQEAKRRYPIGTKFRTC